MCTRRYLCAYMGHMYAHMGICVSISSIMQLASCSINNRESPILLASHSLPIVWDSQNFFSSASRTSNIKWGGTLKGDGAPCMSNFQPAPPPPQVHPSERVPGSSYVYSDLVGYQTLDIKLLWTVITRP